MITRFAPSPTGPLHLGHAYSALLAHDMARAAGGRFLLRIDDLDASRSRPHWETQIYDDLAWLGLTWDNPPICQSQRFAHYTSMIVQLHGQTAAVYPCSCKRRDIQAAASAPQEGVAQFGPDGPIYPGTCRARAMQSRQPTDALRLNLDKLNGINPTTFKELGPLHAGSHSVSLAAMRTLVGDPVLARANMAASYNLAIVFDDAMDGVTHVIRGADLFEATHVQVFLQSLLGYETPLYLHHDLIRDEAGKRLAKRDDARAIATYRAEGKTPQDIRAMVGL
ncbi:tRNA glutamyl-Q(34) synthetase GluQRS [Primorskyibacter sp. S187A]|uniref:tRNA glutamyl-Q(34) synthetase GluQRS n=1 Tax=Primorskyibacter sp. S187A TaxID=3415130 RepID=UPI003C7C55FE